MPSIEKNKCKSTKGKHHQQNSPKFNPQSIQKTLNKNSKSRSVKNNLSSCQKSFLIPVTTISTHKQKSTPSLDKSNKKLTPNKSHPHLSSNYSSKQPNCRQISQQKQKMKYIFNSVTSTKNRNSLVINRQKQHLAANQKCYSNQTFVKHVPNQSYDLSSFAKSIDSIKMKKKSHDYLKSFNKTSVADKSDNKSQKAFADDLDKTCKFSNNWTHPQGFKKLRQIKITDQELNEVNVCQKISQVRQNVKNLFKKLKEPNRNKLLLITNNYEKIVSQLYSKFNGQQKNEIPTYDLSKVKEKKFNVDETQKIKLEKQNIVKINDSSSTSDMEDSSDTEHWESYLQINDFDNQNMQTFPGPKSKQNFVKKLDLGNMKKMQVKQYQDEFMDNQQIFSESWKRQIDQQKRF